MAVMSAFSPIFTYKQFYPTVAGVSIIGILAIIVSFLYNLTLLSNENSIEIDGTSQ